ncbi:hypothetical protein VNO77_27167 [Canavalia gladiata]|uniref:Uncharacterized protein n=1 Tax=Canavalia gladiata TaxID=3824 RepID=A0AAN9KV97_CANGL
MPTFSNRGRVPGTTYILRQRSITSRPPVSQLVHGGTLPMGPFCFFQNWVVGGKNIVAGKPARRILSLLEKSSHNPTHLNSTLYSPTLSLMSYSSCGSGAV